LGRAVLLALSMLMAPMILATETCTETTQLRVYDEQGKLLVNLPMPEDAGWCLAWNHSVEGFLVHDCYRNQGGRMVLDRSHQPDFAAGLGHIPGRGRQVSDGQGGYWIENISEPVPGNRYRLRVGSLRVDHRLVSDGEPSLRDLLSQAMQHDEVCYAERYPSVGDRPLEISLSNLAANQLVIIGLNTSITP
jgi:hypothetical protein